MLEHTEWAFKAMNTKTKMPRDPRKAQIMPSKVGVWIDYKKAVVVSISGKEKKITKIAFDIGQPIRSAGGSRSTKPYKPKEYVAEDTLERKLENDRKDYFDDVIATFRGADGVLIIGPGEAKGELLKRVQSKKLHGVTVELETVDKMTDRQIAARVALHFAKPAATKSAGSKRTALKKTGKKSTAVTKSKNPRKVARK
jgi:hypothetical protein